jgi:hypothetical protein
MASNNNEGLGSYVKVMVMGLFLCFDLGLNCTLDYEKFNDNHKSYPQNFLLGLVGLQVIIEVSIFLLLFLCMADTFLFRVGMLGLLLRKFRLVLMFHPIYIAFTLAAGLVRTQRIVNQSYTLSMVWNDDTFAVLSSLQKVVGVIYSVLNLRASITLGESIYFDKREWISRIRQQQKKIGLKVNV